MTPGSRHTTAKSTQHLLLARRVNFLVKENNNRIKRNTEKAIHSTINQLAFLYHTFCQAIDNKKEMRIVFCDVSKAFEKVWHEGLLYMLSSIGICEHLLRWFQDYLSKRQQRVLVRGQTSDWGTIEAGVPQGSVLGPLLFLIYVNDMVKVVSCGVKLFADDTLMYITVDNPELTTVELNRNMDKIKSVGTTMAS